VPEAVAVSVSLVVSTLGEMLIVVAVGAVLRMVTVLDAAAVPLTVPSFGVTAQRTTLFLPK
jgi:hypothetical protein